MTITEAVPAATSPTFFEFSAGTAVVEPPAAPAAVVEPPVEGQVAAEQAAAEPSALGGVADWAVGMMESIGAPGAGLAIALENLFPPLPSEIILPLAGFTASQGSFSLTAALFWTTLGSVLGALALYGLGAWLGRDRMRRVVAKVPLVDLEDVDKVEAWFERHGYKAVFFGRMIPLFRSLISIPAGIERMGLLTFSALTTAGSLIWNTIFILAGYYLGESWHLVEAYAGVFQKIVIAAVVIAAVWFVAAKVRSSRRKPVTGEDA
ncbi:DedA family protein [Arthrobacter sp. zg-Y20]|uniref:DedA family protein n=1 Tax=unclassified Arthrobacter TaxID=235627 RepID=UPI001D1542A8|nr:MULTISPECIES: DedA family protein [unclassified Arthrobacter]MCC3276969.1 DedA family protein [Arthrobacter sp. zg-Y20]MDK1317130.1 DedA family protein [Arthrobacter sp. zg.Y20]WIB05163.1 DedA family protein [Arthrobacter sp. zg-Y20]